MMKKWIVLSFMLLVGCKSISDIRQNKPDMAFESSKPVDQITECILYGWQDTKTIFGEPMRAFIQPFPNGKTVYIDGNFAVADISRLVNEKTAVKLYLPKKGEAWISVVKTCV